MEEIQGSSSAGNISGGTVAGPLWDQIDTFYEEIFECANWGKKQGTLIILSIWRSPQNHFFLLKMRKTLSPMSYNHK